jgi:hypothetical protein
VDHYRRVGSICLKRMFTGEALGTYYSGNYEVGVERILALIVYFSMHHGQKDNDNQRVITVQQLGTSSLPMGVPNTINRVPDWGKLNIFVRASQVEFRSESMESFEHATFTDFASKYLASLSDSNIF